MLMDAFRMLHRAEDTGPESLLWPRSRILMEESVLKAVGMVPVKELDARDSICRAIPVDDVDNRRACPSFSLSLSLLLLLLLCVLLREKREGTTPTLVVSISALMVVVVVVVVAAVVVVVAAVVVVVVVVGTGNGPPSKLLLRSSVCSVFT